MYLNMNLLDLHRWEHGTLPAFAVPCDPDDVVQAGDVLCIKEPFKRITMTEAITTKEGEEKSQKVLVAIRYCSDDKLCVPETSLALDATKFAEAVKRSATRQMPDFAIRRYALVTKTFVKPLSEFDEDDLHLMGLDYASQNDPQLLMKEYLPIKNAELLHDWWKQHYKNTLKDCNDPMAVLLHIEPYISK